MKKWFSGAICALALWLAGCAITGGTPENSPGLQRALAEARQTLQRSPDPRVIYVGFAMHSQSTAFGNDVAHGAQFARHLDPQAVVIELVNPALFASGGVALATRSNIPYTLRELAGMAREQDKFVLLFSTHGLPGLLAMNVGNSEQRPVPAADVADWIVPLRGKPTVLLISACYSGSLIDKLKDSSRIILTAAAPDRASFGCRPSSDGTFFIDGLLGQDLSGDPTLSKMMETARESIEKREASMNLTPPSSPQADSGAHMQALSIVPLSKLRTARYQVK